jgi:hypothetical protein
MHVSETRRGLIYGIPHGVQTELATFVSDSLGFSRLWNEVLDSMDLTFIMVSDPHAAALYSVLLVAFDGHKRK